jgi:hypothetical protein
MADVTHSSAGFPGTVDAVAEAKRWTLATGVPFKAASSTAWAVTAYASANRTVQIAAGQGVCCGVEDTTSAAATLTVATNTSGSTRNDVVVASFNWSTNLTTFAVITGTSSGIPTINTGGSVVAGQINRIPGVQYDAVLAVVPVPNNAAVLSSSSVLDRRLYGSNPLSIADTSFLTAVDVGGAGQVRSVATGAVWQYTAGTWTRLPSNNKTFSTLAARDSFFSGLGGLVAGDECICLNVDMNYDGTKWRFTLSRIDTVGSDANGFITFNHGGGQAPFAWTIVPAYQSSDALSTIVQILSSNNAGDTAVLGCRAVRTDTNGYLVNNPINVNWTAQF